VTIILRPIREDSYSSLERRLRREETVAEYRSCELSSHARVLPIAIEGFRRAPREDECDAASAEREETRRESAEDESRILFSGHHDSLCKGI
jgi:hypothetical protein